MVAASPPSTTRFIATPFSNTASMAVCGPATDSDPVLVHVYGGRGRFGLVVSEEGARFSPPARWREASGTDLDSLQPRQGTRGGRCAIGHRAGSCRHRASTGPA